MQESLAGVLHEVVGLLDRSAAAILKRETGLSYRQYYVLSAVARLGRTHQHELAEHIGHSDAAVSRMLVTLSEAGYVTVAADLAHRRRNTVALTPTGAAREQQAGTLLDDALTDLLRQHDIDDDQLLSLAAALRGALRGAGWSARPLRHEPS
ncbi:DNA-binding transcriptional regulator, MarR family [Rathayibacter oskolensis]|uniref:DNA-binding transcriptional regulator, MarR family n=1 Tax=Rathayibacter oskolensis TaxID=1891671 RepID=A0A1X7MU51_9MICO|nr:MarR family winged helix-turn-helix transcriptional regulator [Rathayibacter oskolensis]SMH28165.1 DNA-binding transcriptional regulator, MarR family [Rathayibacter oskolensis]